MPLFLAPFFAFFAMVLHSDRAFTFRNINVATSIESILEKLRIQIFAGFPGISTVEVVNGKREQHDSQTPLVLIVRNEKGARRSKKALCVDVWLSYAEAVSYKC